MTCQRCKGAGILIRRGTIRIAECPQCEGTGSADPTDLAGIGLAEGGIARPFSPSRQEMQS